MVISTIHLYVPKRGASVQLTYIAAPCQTLAGFGLSRLSIAHEVGGHHDRLDTTTLPWRPPVVSWHEASFESIDRLEKLAI